MNIRTLRIKRVYEPPASEDGCRVLVDRLWPRGLSKQRAAVDEWIRELAPSTELRRWFAHDPARWDGFKRRYFRELSAPIAREGLAKLQALAAEHDRITLVYAASDEEHNDAVALREYLGSLGRRKRADTPARRRTR